MERFPGWDLPASGRLKANALSMLFRSARKWKGQGGALRVEDEYHHAHDDSYYWNESYYFNFTDPDHRVGGFSRIGMVPNQQTAVGILYLFPPEGGVLALVQSEQVTASRDDVSVGLLRYERVEPLWEWKIRFAGSMLYLEDPRDHLALVDGDRQGDPAEALRFRDASVDLTFRGWSPCHDFKSADPAFVAERFTAVGSRLGDLQAVAKVASEHYEQVGSWSGRIRLDDRTLEVRGSGHRDHSWGDRDWKAPERWTWLTAQFGDAFGFNVSRVVIKSLDLFNGYVSRDRRNHPLRRVWLETEFEADGRTQRRLRLRLQDVTGWEAEVEGVPRTVVPLLLQEGDHRTLVNEAFTEYRWRDRTGFGISEYLHQLGPR